MNQKSPADSSVVEVQGLTRRFGKQQALCDVDLRISPGTVFGLVGENGAGKTTLVSHLLGILRAQQGTVRVLGMDPVQEPEAVLARVGYLSEKRDIPLWMRIDELLRYTSAFYPTWDHAYAAELLQKFALSPNDRLRTLSNGQQARAALITAVAHRPELLLLDEPSAGLDPVVRRDILGAIIRTVSDEGRTVLFSSHLLDEVERVSDHIGMIHRGRLVISGPLDEVKQAHRRLTIRFDQPPSSPPQLPGILSIDGGGREYNIVGNGDLVEMRAAAQRAGGQIVEEQVPSLEEIFIARVARYGMAQEIER